MNSINLLTLLCDEIRFALFILNASEFMLQEVVRTRSEMAHNFLEALERGDVKEISEYLLIHHTVNQDSIATRDWENIIFKKMIMAYLITEKKLDCYQLIKSLNLSVDAKKYLPELTYEEAIKVLMKYEKLENLIRMITEQTISKYFKDIKGSLISGKSGDMELLGSGDRHDDQLSEIIFSKNNAENIEITGVSFEIVKEVLSELLKTKNQSEALVDVMKRDIVISLVILVDHTLKKELGDSTLVTLASKEKKYQALKFLLDFGADIHANGNTSLHCVVSNRDLETIVDYKIVNSKNELISTVDDKIRIHRYINELINNNNEVSKMINTLEGIVSYNDISSSIPTSTLEKILKEVCEVPDMIKDIDSSDHENFSSCQEIFNGTTKCGSRTHY